MSSFPAQRVVTVTNADSVALPRGTVVRGSMARFSAVRAQANNAAGVTAMIGVIQSDGNMAVGTAMQAVTGGVAEVRLQDSLSPNNGDELWVSPTVAGRATTVQPSSNAVRMGSIVDASQYANTGRVVALVGAPGIAATSGGAASETLQIAADDMRVPTLGGWYTLGIAPLDNDTGDRETSLPQRTFAYDAGGYDPAADPPTMQGAGTQQIEIPAGATQLALTLWHRNINAAAAGDVGFRLAYIQNPNNAVDSAWLTHDLTDLSLPNDANLQKTTQTITFASMGTPIVAGDMYTFQFCRKAPAGSELANSWGLILAKMVFS